MKDVEDAAEGDGDDPPDAEAGEDQREAGHSIIGELCLYPCQQAKRKYCLFNCRAFGNTTDYVLHEVRQTGVLLEAVGVKTNISLTVTHTTLGTYHVCHLLINVGADLMTFVCDKRL